MLRRILGILVLASLLLAACGGGDDEGGSTEPAGGTSNGTTAGSGETGGSGDGAVGAIDAAQCAEVAAAMAAAASALPAAFSGSTSDLDTSLAQMRAFAEAAPDEIKADMQTIVEGYAKIAEALQAADFDPTSGQAPPPEVIAQLTQVSEELDSEEFTSAVDRVNAYFASCGG
jgi:hypothetical protein